MQQTQNFGNHTKLVPMFHFVVLPILFINLVSSIMHAVHSFPRAPVSRFSPPWRYSFWLSMLVRSR